MKTFSYWLAYISLCLLVTLSFAWGGVVEAQTLTPAPSATKTPVQTWTPSPTFDSAGNARFNCPDEQYYFDEVDVAYIGQCSHCLTRRTPTPDAVGEGLPEFDIPITTLTIVPLGTQTATTTMVGGTYYPTRTPYWQGTFTPVPTDTPVNSPTPTLTPTLQPTWEWTHYNFTYADAPETPTLYPIYDVSGAWTWDDDMGWGVPAGHACDVQFKFNLIEETNVVQVQIDSYADSIFIGNQLQSALGAGAFTMDIDGYVRPPVSGYQSAVKTYFPTPHYIDKYRISSCINGQYYIQGVWVAKAAPISTYTPTPDATITPTFTPTATQNPQEVDCRNPYGHDVLPPLVETDALDYSIVARECYTVIPDGFYIDLSFVNPDFVIGIDGLEVCVNYVRLPNMAILGINLPFGALVVTVLVGFFFRRFSTF